MGPAIRAAIAAAIRELTKSLNQIVEKSASWRALRWRIEARATGRSFSEVLLARSMLYSVEQVFLIHRGSGILLMHVAAENAVVKDADMVSGMFSAIQEFVSDSFTDSTQELETIDVGRYKLWMQYGPRALLVGAVSGTAPVELRGVFRAALEQVHEKLFAALDTFKQGDVSVFDPARPYLESCLLGQRAPSARGRQVAPWLVLGVILAILGALIFWQVRQRSRWDSYLDAIRGQPGLVILNAEQRGSGGVISGLKDPKAPDPARLLPGFQLDPGRIRYEWYPYLSLNTPFAVARELDAEAERIQARIVRFEIGKASLPISEAGRIAAITRLLRAHPNARVALTGHTDELGSDDANAKLSLDRALSVGQALIAQGIPAASLRLSSAGNAQPIRPGGTDWDRAANRSVSIRVELSASSGDAPARP